MSILSMIREKKEKFSQRQNVRSAAKLQKLKKQRVKAEGKNNISRLKDQERSRIKNVRSERLERRTRGIKKAVSGLKKIKDASDKRQSFGRGFGSSNNFGSGSSGVNPAFGLGKEKKAEKKEESVFRIRIK